MIKLWKKLSISVKLFICTAAMFSAVLLLFFLGQLFFYEKYYYFILESTLKNTLSNFSQNYSNLQNDEDINQNIAEISGQNDAFIFILSENGNIRHMSSYDLHIESSGEKYTILLDNAIQDESFFDLELETGQEITITFMQENLSDSNHYIAIPTEIEYNEKKWTYKKELPPARDGRYNIKTISGTVTFLSLPSNAKSRISIQRNEAFDAIMFIRKDGNFITNDNSFTKHRYINDENNSRYFLISYKLKDTNEYVVAVKSLQSVSEAVYILKDIIGLWFFGILFIALILSIIFSRLVTRPIIKITDITKKIKTLDFSAKCNVSSGGEIGVLAENINDMSEQLNYTINELLKANEQLKKDIEHERIIEKQRKEFIAVISHELKTPLGIIRAYSEGLIDGVANQDKYLNVIINETQKMDALILDMLEDSKLELGNQHIDLKYSNLTEYVTNVTKKFKEPCKTKNITFIENISNETIMKTFDKDLLERVITNFISNAIKYAENKKITITLNHNIFSVENEGEHIPEIDLEKIWDKFYCVGKSTNHFTGGTGLGLSIAKNILNLHNAEFSVKNTEKGVMFWFSLPE